MTDVLPTLASAANISVNVRNLDGVDQWQVISEDLPTVRKEILYNIESVLSFSAIMNDGWKVVNGTESLKYSSWLGESGAESKLTFKDYAVKVQNSVAAQSLPSLTSNEIKIIQEKSSVKCKHTAQKTKCNPFKSPCLFNIIDDPCEQNNLANEEPEKVKFLLSRLSHHITEMVPSRRAPIDPMCDPKLHNYHWTWWIDEEVKVQKEDSEKVLIFGFYFSISAAVILIIFLRCSRRKSGVKK